MIGLIPPFPENPLYISMPRLASSIPSSFRRRGRGVAFSQMAGDRRLAVACTMLIQQKSFDPALAAHAA
jgi:hypothetical protein